MKSYLGKEQVFTVRDGTTTERKRRKAIHLAATIWFVACVAYLVGAGLRQAGFRWWLVFSLSGYSTFGVLLAVSFYLFAFVHGIGGARRSVMEHPLTSADWYLGFYVSAPLLGGLVTFLATLDRPGAEVSFVHVAVGTLKMTCVAWIMIDPLLGVLEMLSPASRRCRAERRAQRTARDELVRKNVCH